MARSRFGERGAESPALGPHLDRQYQRQYPRCPSRRQPKAPAPLPGGILLPLQPSLLGTTNVQPHASCLCEYLGYNILGAKAIGVFINIFGQISKAHFMVLANNATL